jgi:hypothetical protein
MHRLASSTITRLLRSFPLLLLLLAAGATRAQVDNVYVYGTVKDYATSKKLDGIIVTVYKNGGKLAEVVTNASGKYEFNLDYGSDYKLVYSKPGMVSKNISIDTKNIPEEERVGGHGMNVEMTLFAELPGIDFSVLQQPIGKAKFDAATKEVTWDLQYTEQVRAEIARLMKEYDEKKKREANADQEFARLMQQGETSMTAADYKKAVDSFTAALGLKPGDAKATAKLSDAKMKLDEVMAAQKEGEKYGALIKEADGFFIKKDYANALAKYQAASEVKEQEAYPKQRMKECQAFIDELAKKAEEERKARELEEKYKAAITAADAAFKAEKYEEARGRYTDASGLKPAEKYPKDQLAAITRKLEELAKKAEDEKKQRELDEKYRAAIAAADGAFKSAKYEEARGGYTEASALKPGEKYPKDQLDAIARKLDELAKKAEEEKKQKELDERYAAAIAKADAAFKGDKFDEAKAGYNEAIGLKSKEKYPVDQLAAIEKRIAELAAQAEKERQQKELDARYNAAIAAGDAAFQAQQWEPAREKYNEALKLKAAEKYPKDQLAAIDKAIADAARKAEEERRQQELDAKYQALITAADGLFTGKKLEEAKGKYREAGGLKPAEAYPKERMAEIDALLAEAARKAEEERRQRELDERYAAIITAADGLFKGQKLELAKAKYQEAGGVKPAENYPRERIAEIDVLLADLARKAEEERKRKELDERYAALIASADRSYGNKKYAEALNDYKDALQIKPDEKHPKDRIADIEGRLDAEAQAKAEAERLERERLERDKRYADLVAAADASFNGQQYDAAKRDYAAALEVKPEEKYPKGRLAEIDRILADMAAKADADRIKAEQDAAERARLEDERRKRDAAAAEVEARYRDAVALGDAAFSAEDWDKARGHFNDAIGIKPDERYPKDRLAAIDQLLAGRQKSLSDAAAAEAERLRAEEERRRRAAEEAEAARLAQQSEQERLAAEKAREEQYRNTIAQADAAMGNERYDEARGLYTQALDIKPAETYPPVQIDRIDKLLAEQERKRREAELAAQRQPEPEPEPEANGSTVDIRKEQEAEQFMREALLREEAEKYERIKKQKVDRSEQESGYRNASTDRQTQVRGSISNNEAGAGLYAGSDDGRRRYWDELQAQREAWAQRQRQARERADQDRGATLARQEELRGRNADATGRLQEAQAGRLAEVQGRKDVWAQASADEVASGNTRREQQMEEVRRRAEQGAELDQRGRSVNAPLVDAVQREKEQRSLQQRQLANRSEDARLATKEQLDRLPLNKEHPVDDINRSKLASEYPQGVTEESYTEGNKVIIRRVVVRGNKADNYTKVIGKVNTCYFKNGQIITEWIWSRDTE